MPWLNSKNEMSMCMFFYLQLKANPESGFWVEAVDLGGDPREHQQGVGRKAKTG